MLKENEVAAVIRSTLDVLKIQRFMKCKIPIKPVMNGVMLDLEKNGEIYKKGSNFYFMTK